VEHPAEDALSAPVLGKVRMSVAGQTASDHRLLVPFARYAALPILEVVRLKR